MSSTPQPSLDAIGAHLLALHRSAHELPLRRFQSFALESLASLVPFDSGLVATATLQNGAPVVHDVYLHRQPIELMQSWERLKRQDRVALAAMSNPGRTVWFAVDEVFADDDAILDHCRRFGIGLVLCTAHVESRARSCTLVSLYRADDARPPTPAELSTAEVVVPHVVEGLRRSRLAQLRRTIRATSAPMTCAAIVNRGAVVLEADPGFLELVASLDPRWEGPLLPTAMRPFALARTAGRHVVGRVVVRVEPTEDLLLLEVRRATVVDTLSVRELEVAQHYAAGDSTKDTAARLGIAPNTVRAHIARIYEKLGVVNKAELATMLSGMDVR